MDSISNKKKLSLPNIGFTFLRNCCLYKSKKFVKIQLVNVTFFQTV